MTVAANGEKLSPISKFICCLWLGWCVLTLVLAHILDFMGLIGGVGAFCQLNPGVDFGYTCQNKIIEFMISYFPHTVLYLIISPMGGNPMLAILGLLMTIPYLIAGYFLYRVFSKSPKAVNGFVVFLCLALGNVPAQAETITISNNACAYATEHQPAPDVEYQPGIDTDGNAVTPADLSGQGGIMPWPQDITIPLALDLQNALHIPNNRLTGTDAIIGVVEYKNGKFTFNGEPLGQETEAQIQAACQQSRLVDQQTSRLGKKNLLRGD